MKLTASSVAEFEKFSEKLKSLETLGQMLQSGQVSEGANLMKAILEHISTDELECQDMFIKKSYSLTSEILRLQLFLTTETSVSAEIQQKKLRHLKKLNANLQSKILVMVSAMNAYKNPSLGNRFSAWFARIADKFSI